MPGENLKSANARSKYCRTNVILIDSQRKEWMLQESLSKDAGSNPEQRGQALKKGTLNIESPQNTIVPFSRLVLFLPITIRFNFPRNAP